MRLIRNRRHLNRSSSPRNLLPQAQGPFSKAHLEYWGQCTHDSWVLTTIRRGYLQFSHVPPPFRGVVHTLVKDPRANNSLAQELKTLLQKQAIRILPPSDMVGGFYSKYFLVPKRDDGLRPILDLRQVNLYLSRRRFKMLTLRQLSQFIRPGDWFTTVDLQDAYFSHSHKTRAPEVSSVRLSREGLRIPCTAVRPIPSAMRFHEMHGRYPCHSETQGYQSSKLPGRLAHLCGVARSGAVTHGTCH